MIITCLLLCPSQVPTPQVRGSDWIDGGSFVRQKMRHGTCQKIKCEPEWRRRSRLLSSRRVVRRFC